MISKYTNLILIFCFLINICLAIIVNDENEFIKAIKNNESDIVINDNIIIHESVIISKNEIIIEGVQNKNCSLEFYKVDDNFSFENINKVLNIKNIIINGNIIINNVRNVNFDNVVIYGSIEASSETSDNNLFIIDKLKMNCMEFVNSSKKECLNINNFNMSISNSNIIGNNLINNGILNFVGENMMLNITKSIINGSYSNWGIKMKNNYINIDQTNFINCSNYVNEGYT